MDIVLNGKRGTAMAPFGKQLSDTDVAVVITFARNNWGNKTGEVIQLNGIRSARERPRAAKRGHPEEFPSKNPYRNKTERAPGAANERSH
jgi:hypothetical protein